ncbi:hypothetical protein PVK06_013444 [Gossypium arboreum]|uniref:Uncharacterized protein n=1 Tax=Gossypium arboreum TaxID=29729 RepID=A0ABR0PRM6_GOSAR|nr:hypothetical protein PVK06_013444 [Gossypium arboreum]
MERDEKEEERKKERERERERETEKKKTIIIIFMYYKLIVLEVALFVKTTRYRLKKPQVPCYFIFGDSLSDNGNNNNLATEAKVNYWPYGIDFPKGPTGRFTNGRTMQDIIVQLLGFQEFIPPFATSRGQEILKGVNYASGSAGILNDSGQHLGVRISMNMQLSNHQSVISTIVEMLGNCAASKLLGKCMYAVQIGSNDYINNYFKPEMYNSSHLFTPEQYAAYLIEQYSRQIKVGKHNGA